MTALCGRPRNLLSRGISEGTAARARCETTLTRWARVMHGIGDRRMRGEEWRVKVSLGLALAGPIYLEYTRVIEHNAALAKVAGGIVCTRRARPSRTMGMARVLSHTGLDAFPQVTWPSLAVSNKCCQCVSILYSRLLPLRAAGL